MLTIQDCIELCHLDADEIKAIAEHEHLPDITAIELGEYLVTREDGPPLIRRMILDDIEAARKRGDEIEVQRYLGALKRFIASYSGVDEGSH